MLYGYGRRWPTWIVTVFPALTNVENEGARSRISYSRRNGLGFSCAMCGVSMSFPTLIGMSAKKVRGSVFRRISRPQLRRPSIANHNTSPCLVLSASQTRCRVVYYGATPYSYFPGRPIRAIAHSRRHIFRSNTLSTISGSTPRHSC